MLIETAPPKRVVYKKQTKKQILSKLPKNADKDCLIFLDTNLQIQHWDLWGLWDNGRPSKLISKGLIVAKSDEKCPIWKDKIPWKSETILVPKELISDRVLNDIDTLLGRNGHYIVKQKKLKDGSLAMRASIDPMFI